MCLIKNAKYLLVPLLMFEISWFIPFWKALIFGFLFHSTKTDDNKQTVLQRQFNRQGFGYPWQHLTASSAVAPSSTPTRVSKAPSWKKSSPWTSMSCPTTPLRQRSSRSSGSKRDAVYILSALKVFLKKMKQKRPGSSSTGTTPPSTPCASSGTSWPPRRRSRWWTPPPPPDSLDQAPATSSCFASWRIRWRGSSSAIDFHVQVGRCRCHPQQGRLHRVLRQVGGEAIKVY